MFWDHLGFFFWLFCALVLESWQDPWGEELRLSCQWPCEWVLLKLDSSAPVKLWDDWSPCWPPILVRPTITKYHRLGGSNNLFLFLTVQESRESKFRALQIWCLARTLFWFMDSQPLVVFSHGAERELQSSLLIRTLTTAWGAPPPRLHLSLIKLLKGIISWYNLSRD